MFNELSQWNESNQNFCCIALWLGLYWACDRCQQSCLLKPWLFCIFFLFHFIFPLFVGLYCECSHIRSSPEYFPLLSFPFSQFISNQENIEILSSISFTKHSTSNILASICLFYCQLPSSWEQAQALNFHKMKPFQLIEAIALTERVLWSSN